MSAPRTIRRRAFTLLELVIALALTCLLAASIFASLYVAFKAREVADRAVSPIRSAGLAMEMLRAEFDGIQPQRGIFEGTYTGLSNQDDQGNDQAQFYSVADGPQQLDGTGEVKQVTLLVYQPNGSSDHVLVRRVISNLLATATVNPDEEVIARHVSSFKMRYFDGAQWQTDWDATQYGNVLPAAVEVTLELRPPDAPAGSAPLHLRRIFAMPCVGPPNAGADSPSSSSGTGTGNKSSGGGGK